MTKYLLAYRGGGMGDTAEAQAEAMTEWMNWFGALGESVIDGGAPFGESATLQSAIEVAGEGASGLSGYSVIEASSLDEATDKAKGCPVLTAGGTVEVYETAPIG